jgi:hypothetical protein
LGDLQLGLEALLKRFFMATNNEATINTYLATARAKYKEKAHTLQKAKMGTLSV